MNIKLILIALLIIIGCGFLIIKVNNEGNNMAEASNSNKKVLVVYFSRIGEQYSVGNITEALLLLLK